MRLSRTLALGATMLVLAVSACSSGGGSSKPEIKARNPWVPDEDEPWLVTWRGPRGDADTVNRDGIGTVTPARRAGD